jgi:hypothetical protein
MKTSRNLWMLLLLLSIGMVIGGILGEILKEKIKILNYSNSIGFKPFMIDLQVAKLTLGLVIHFNIASIIGIIIALFIFSRM